MLFLGACTSPNNAGEEVLSDDDLVSVHYTDTFTLEMRTVQVDSVVSSRLSRCLFGNYVDEQFGRISAETYLQPRLTGSNLSFGSNPALLSLDSIVLSLDLLDFYGRYNEPLAVEIFQLTGDFSADSIYYSTERIAADTTYDLAGGYEVDFSGQPGFFDFINIRLDDSLGRKLLFAPTDSISGNGPFLEFFKGLLIRSKAVNAQNSREPGGIFAFDPRSSKTALTLHYHDNGVKKSHVFAINDASARFHHLERSDVGGRMVELALNNGGSNASYGAIQAGALLKLFVNVPSLLSLDPSGINRADLILPVDQTVLGSQERYVPPTTVFLFLADSAGTAEYDISQFNSSADYDAAAEAYTLPVTNTVQQILAGRLPNNGFLIVPGNNGVSLNRALFYGPGHPTLQPKLRVMFTKLPG